MPGILFIHKEHLITTVFDFVLLVILYPGYYTILLSIQCVLVDRMVFIVDNGKSGEIVVCPADVHIADDGVHSSPAATL